MAFENPLNLSVEEMVGHDTNRIWVTGLQVFANPDFTMVVLREQMNVEDEGGEATKTLTRNVGSLVMPTPVAVQLRDILNRVFADAPNAS